MGEMVGFFSGRPAGEACPEAPSGPRDRGVPPRPSRWVRTAAGRALALLALSASACTTVPPGHAAVALAPSGLRPDVLPEGVSPIPWFGQVYLYDTREQTLTLRFNAISRDGSPVTTSASVVTYRIVPEELVALARELGPNYADVLIRPEVEAALRLVVGGLGSDELDTEHILAAQVAVKERSEARLRPYHILLESVDFRTLQVVSPLALEQVGAALVLQQRLLEAPRQLEIIRKEAEARREEAAGIAQNHEALEGSLSAPTLADLRRRAWDALLRTPSSTVHVKAAGTPAIVEVPP
jgi:regulator of protease activity HflC (stomatin/prohibitin superfamily)